MYLRELLVDYTQAKFQKDTSIFAFLYHCIAITCDFFTWSYEKFYTSFISRSYLVSSAFISKIAILASTETEILTNFPSFLGINTSNVSLPTLNTVIRGKTHAFYFLLRYAKGRYFEGENKKSEVPAFQGSDGIKIEVT